MVLLENLALLIPYQCLMLYGIFWMLSFWAASATRGIPPLLFLAFGLAAPISGWFLSIFLPWASCVIPASLGLLYAWARAGDARERALASVILEDDRAQAYRMIAADGDNAAGYWALGKVLETEEKYEAALKHYEKAHQLSDRAISSHELKDARDELESLMEAQRLQALRPAGLVDALRRCPAESLCFAAGLSLGIQNPGFAANVCSLMLFVAWFRRQKPRRRV